MCVKTKLGLSKIHGIGLFADEFIPKGTIIWKFTPGFDQKFTKEQISRFPKQVQEHIKVYGWLSKKSGKYCLCSDNGNFFNHSKNPNSLSEHYDDEDEVIVKAIKDIKKGEEITDDYSAYNKEFKENWN